MNAFELELPRTLEAAVALLSRDDPSVRLMSGGTALMLMMKTDVFRPSRIVSLRDLGAEHSSIERLSDGSMRIGAMTTLSQLEHDDALADFAPVIRETMKVLSTVRVRNVATVGGALAHGDPHMDLPPVLVSLGAHVVALGPSGERRIPVEELHLGYYETCLEGDELIRDVIIPPQNGWRSAYLKCTTRAAKDWPALGMAVSVSMNAGTVADSRIVVGSVAERPLRVPEAEAAIRGQALGDGVIAAAAEAAAGSVETIPDELGSAAYKTQLVRVYLQRALRAVASQVA